MHLSFAPPSGRALGLRIDGEPRAWETLPSDDPEPLELPELERAPFVFTGVTLALP